MKFGGKKFSGNHTTVIDAAENIIKLAEREILVRKISLGIIKQCKMGQGNKNLKIEEVPAGLKLTVKGNAYAQTIYLYIDEPGINNKVVSDRLKKEFFD